MTAVWTAPPRQCPYCYTDRGDAQAGGDGGSRVRMWGSAYCCPPHSPPFTVCARSLCCSFAAHTDILVPLPHFLAPVATFRARARMRTLCQWTASFVCGRGGFMDGASTWQAEHPSAAVHRRAGRGEGEYMYCVLLPSPPLPFAVCVRSRGVSVGATHPEALALAERRWRDER